MSFFVNLRCAVLKNQNESNDIKKSYLFICRLIPLIAIIIVVGIYICNLIPVLQYKLNDKYEHINGIVENFEKDGKIERFTVNGVYFQTFSNEIQLTYSGGLIREGMQVDIEYYNDSSINRIFKITIHEN